MAIQHKILQVRITARDRQILDAFLYEHRVDVLSGAPKRDDTGTVSIEALVPEDQFKRLKKPGVTIDILDKDARATARARRKKASKGNPFGDSGVPRGLGRKVKEGGRGLS